MQGFSVEAVYQMFEGSMFNEILVLGRALKFRVIFQKCALKLIKLSEFFLNFYVWENNKFLRMHILVIQRGYNGSLPPYAIRI